MDESDRLIAMFRERAGAPVASKLDALIKLERSNEPGIVPFMVHILADQREAEEVRIHVLKRLRNGRLSPDHRSLVADAILHILQNEASAALRLQASIALAEFTDIDGVPATLGQFLQRLRAGPRDDRSRFDNGLLRIEAAGARLERLVNELADDLHAGPAGRQLPMRQMIDLVELTRRIAAESMRNFGSSNRVAIFSSTTALVGHWDPVCRERLTANVIDNALKYSPGDRLVLVGHTFPSGTRPTGRTGAMRAFQQIAGCSGSHWRHHRRRVIVRRHSRCHDDKTPGAELPSIWSVASSRRSAMHSVVGPVRWSDVKAE